MQDQTAETPLKTIMDPTAFPGKTYPTLPLIGLASD